MELDMGRHRRPPMQAADAEGVCGICHDVPQVAAPLFNVLLVEPICNCASLCSLWSTMNVEHDEAHCAPATARGGCEPNLIEPASDTAQGIAKLDCCAHTFCFDCASEWAGRQNTCPVRDQWCPLRRSHSSTDALIPPPALESTATLSLSE